MVALDTTQTNRTMNTHKHEFALYNLAISEKAAHLKPGELLKIDDKDLCHRILHVLRIKPNESLILFNQQHNARCIFKSTEKKNILVLEIVSFQANNALHPAITFCLPLLKREAFQESIYALTELGANSIQPIISNLSRRNWGDTREYERAERIVHAAAEQSKNFAFPTISSTANLKTFLESTSKKQTIIFFDPEGQPLMETIKQLQQKTIKELILIVGPEADLTPDEKEILKRHTVIFCSLTPTVLRAQQAVAISLGSFRSLLNPQ